MPVLDDKRHSIGLGRFISNLPPTRAVYRLLIGRLFHRYFNSIAAASDELRNEVFRIRYDVYCEELRFEEPSRFPDKREIDDFDQFALHCLLLHGPSDTFAGCVRLVQVNPVAPQEPLPFERLCHGHMDLQLLAKLVPDRLKIGEISRLAVRSTFRRRKGESTVPVGMVENRKGFGFMRTPWIALGLYLSAAAIGLIKGLDGVFALMEPRLARRLGTYGIKFLQVGDPVEHRGERAPFFISRSDLYSGMPAPVLALLEVIEVDLRKSGAEKMTCKANIQ